MTAANTTAPQDAIDQQLERLEIALRDSPADETELVWIDSRRNGASSGRSRRNRAVSSSVLLVRVIEGGRLGSYRTGGLSAGDLERAIRQALVQARAHAPLAGMPHFPADATPRPEGLSLHDDAIVDLTPDRARQRLRDELDPATHAQLDWVEAHVAVANSRNLRRFAAVTSAEATVRISGGPHGGVACAANRSLGALDLPALEAAARARANDAEVEPWKSRETAVVFSPLATRQLLDVINRHVFSASSYAEGHSLLREHLGIQVFDRSFRLTDDATRTDGIPFPFDLEGTAKQRIELISEGTPRTLALDQRQAAQLGLPPTGHAIGGNDALAQNLFLEPDPAYPQERLLQAADGGLWIGTLSPVECFEPTRIRLRAGLRGVREIRDDRLGAPVEDLLWQGSLLRGVSNLIGIGAHAELGWLGDRGIFGGCSCPSIAMAAIGGLTPMD
jgi:predicted Zn-dependent protease